MKLHCTGFFTRLTQKAWFGATLAFLTIRMITLRSRYFDAYHIFNCAPPQVEIEMEIELSKLISFDCMRLKVIFLLS